MCPSVLRGLLLPQTLGDTGIQGGVCAKRLWLPALGFPSHLTGVRASVLVTQALSARDKQG